MLCDNKGQVSPASYPLPISYSGVLFYLAINHPISLIFFNQLRLIVVVVFVVVAFIMVKQQQALDGWERKPVLLLFTCSESSHFRFLRSYENSYSQNTMCMMSSLHLNLLSKYHRRRPTTNDLGPIYIMRTPRGHVHSCSIL